MCERQSREGRGQCCYEMCTRTQAGEKSIADPSNCTHQGMTFYLRIMTESTIPAKERAASTEGQVWQGDGKGGAEELRVSWAMRASRVSLRPVTW
jgi:hypothetical protein